NVQKISQLRTLKCWPVYKYEIFLDYTSTLQKKATHLCLDVSCFVPVALFKHDRYYSKQLFSMEIIQPQKL
ncbi:hypothetical protein BgiMline_023490, partial [Biomphalaria glabrata]